MSLCVHVFKSKFACISLHVCRSMLCVQCLLVICLRVEVCEGVYVCA